MDKRIRDLYDPTIQKILSCFEDSSAIETFSWQLPSYATKRDAVILANTFRKLVFKVELECLPFSFILFIKR